MLGFKYTGLIGIETSDDNLSAHLILEKSGEDRWDEVRLFKFMAENDVKEGFNRQEIILRISEFQRSRETKLRFLAAVGQEPTAPTGESWEAAGDLTLPPELEPAFERWHRAQTLPKVFHDSWEKGPDGQRRDLKEQVVVDPRLEGRAYVEAGQIVFTIYPAQPGRPGRDVAGKVLPAPQSPSAPWALSEGLVKTREGLKAGASGFVRWGRNWAELHPYRETRLDLAWNETHTDLLLNLDPGTSPEALPQVAEIVQRALDEGAPQELLKPQPELAAALQSVRNGKALKDFGLLQAQSGDFRIEVSPDRLKALLVVDKPTGAGQSLDLKALVARVKASGLRLENWESVKASLQTFLSGSEAHWEGTLCEGKAPTRTGPRRLVFDLDFLTQDENQEILDRLKRRPELLKSLDLARELPPDAVQKAAPVEKGQAFARFEPDPEDRGQPGIDVYGKALAPTPGNDPDVTLGAGLRRVGDGLTADVAGLLEAAELGGRWFLRIRDHRDALIKVERSPDNMEARLTLRPSVGTGRPLSRRLIEEELRQEQVYEGVDGARIEECLDRLKKGQPVDGVVIARGRPAAGDLKRRLTVLVGALAGQSPSKLPWKAAAKEGETVAEYQMLTEEGGEGRDVLGNVIPAASGEAATLKVSPLLKTLPDNERGLLRFEASRCGEVSFDGLTLGFQDSWTLAGVNARTGSLKVPGSVLVEGDVASGLYLMSGGDMKIKGQVGGSLLSADGGIHIAQGVRGEGKAVLRARKSIASGFYERSTVMSVGDTYIHANALNCDIRCNGRVYQKTPGGTLVGGRVKTRLGLEVSCLGSPQGVKTHIHFGQDYLIENQILEEEKEIEKTREAILHLDHLMTGYHPVRDKDKIQSARQRKVLLMKLLQKRGLRLINLRDKYELHHPSQIVIRETLYPGVVIESHGRVFEVSKARQGLKLTFDQNTGHIVEHKL